MVENMSMMQAIMWVHTVLIQLETKYIPICLCCLVNGVNMTFQFNTNHMLQC